MLHPRRFVNALSLSRIGLGFLFVVFFQRRLAFLYASFAIWVVSLSTDLLDGYLARKWSVASQYGRYWDSMGDKSFYAAVIIAFNSQDFLSPLISWALIAREVALYVTRILFIEKLVKIEQTRPWTNWHGYFMHLTLVLGLLLMYAEISDSSFQIHFYLQLSASAALVFGVISVLKFLRLDPRP